jgi:hypothetical protein
VWQDRSIWVVREGRSWFWFLEGNDETGGGVWETDNVGPFKTRRKAWQDAMSNDEDLVDDSYLPTAGW